MSFEQIVKEDVAQSDRRPGVWSYWIAAALTLKVGFLAIVFGLVGSAFAEVFASFGADLPPITQFVVVDHRGLMRVLLLLGFLAQLGLLIFLLAAKTLATCRFVWIAWGCNTAVYLVVIYALYVPIIKLGAVV
jgi:hypothetical protein